MEKLQEFRSHVPTHLIYLSFVVAIFVDLIPIVQPNYHWLPDVMALLILYWLINTPKQINLGSAFVLGLISDISTGSPLGQHALAYTITGFIVLINQRQILAYHYGWQSLVALGTLFGNQVIMALTRYITSGKIADWGYFVLTPLIGAIIWPLLNKVIFLAYKPRKRR